MGLRSRAKRRFNREYRIVVIGDCGVGKSSVTIQFIQRIFMSDYDPQFEDYYRKQCEVDGEKALIDVLDTAGQNERTALREHYLRTGEGFVLVYSVNSRTTFNDISKLHEQIAKSKENSRFPVILVGNKCDLEREVSKEEGEQLARELGCPFKETTAKSYPDAEDVFFETVRVIRRIGHESPSKLKASSKVREVEETEIKKSRSGSCRKKSRKKCKLKSCPGTNCMCCAKCTIM